MAGAQTGEVVRQEQPAGEVERLVSADLSGQVIGDIEAEGNGVNPALLARRDNCLIEP